MRLVADPRRNHCFTDQSQMLSQHSDKLFGYTGGLPRTRTNNQNVENIGIAMEHNL